MSIVTENNWMMEFDKQMKKARTLHLETKEYHQVVNKEIPNAMPKLKRFDAGNYHLRDKFIKEMGFAYVSWKWVNPLVSWLGSKSVLEVMSGKGALSFALRQKGVNVIATDDFSWHDNLKWNTLWTEIEDIDAISAINKYGKKSDVLIMSWAPYNEPIGYEVLKRYNEVNPNGILLVIGEGHGGCTADDNFFRHFQTINDDAFEEVDSCFERWEGIHDYPQIGRYLKRKGRKKD